MASQSAHFFFYVRFPGLTTESVSISGFIGGRRHWLHTAGTPSLTYYFAHPRRGCKATDAMDILPHFQGTAVHDAWSAYSQYRQCKHGLCNAHHLRELTAVVENDTQHWATLFKQFLRSARQVVHDAQVAGQSTLSQPKLDQVERIYALLIDKGLRANPVPDGGWPKASRGRVKKTKTRNLLERLDQRKVGQSRVRRIRVGERKRDSRHPKQRVNGDS